MVMRNRHDGASSPGWWDDLPPAVRSRFGVLTDLDPEPPARPRLQPSAGRFVWAFDAGRLALLFLVVALANVLVLLLALAFLAGGFHSHAPFAVPGR